MLLVLSVENPVARKTYVCIWCGEEILPGEKHRKSVQIFEGEFQCWRAHLECIRMMDCLDSEGFNFEDGFLPHEHRRGKKHEERVAARLVDDPEWRY